MLGHNALCLACVNWTECHAVMRAGLSCPKVHIALLDFVLVRFTHHEQCFV